MDQNGQLPPVYNNLAPNVNGAPAAPVVPLEAMKKPRSRRNEMLISVLKIVGVIAVSLTAVTFIGLFIWIQGEYTEVKTDVDSKMALAVAEAKDEQAMADEAEFLEREKYPYNTFSGPADYGQLTFEYPQTWSVYVAADASNGGDFEAYFNPVQVNTVNNNTINALRVKVLNRSFDSVAQQYSGELNGDTPNLTMRSITIYDTTANLYEGRLPGSELRGYFVIFKIRDKTALLQTDSVLFVEDFNRVLNTVEFNA